MPLILKLKPTRDAGILREIVAIADGHPFVSGFAINLPSGKPDFLKVTVARDSLEKLPGAVGGPPVEDFVNAILGTLKSITQDRYALIAAGGVTTAEAAYTKLKLGATAVQLYTGLVYHGPTLEQADPHRPARADGARRLQRRRPDQREPLDGDVGGFGTHGDRLDLIAATARQRASISRIEASISRSISSRSSVASATFASAARRLLALRADRPNAPAIDRVRRRPPNSAPSSIPAPAASWSVCCARSSK